MAGLFLTSSGTAIGKTYIAQALLRSQCNSPQRRFSACKPIISGWPDDASLLAQTDTGILLEAQNQPCLPMAIEQCTPWRFRLPLTPASAAIAEQREIDWSHLLAFCHHRLDAARQQKQIHLIEGVGGVMAPLTPKKTVLDWMVDLNLPVLLVVGNDLGTLSHTLTAIETLKQKRLKIAAVVMNAHQESTVTLQDNRDCLQAFLGEIPLFTCTFSNNPSENALDELVQYLLTYCQNREKVMDVCA